LWLVAALVCAGCLVVAQAAGAFLYWADSDHYAIGRANLDGSAAQDPFGSLGSLSAPPCSIAVTGGYVYWSAPAAFPVATIGRARIDGSAKPQVFATGASSPCGIAAFGHYLYWANGGIYGSIARANLVGPPDVQENFVPSEQASGGGDLQRPCGLAVDATGIYWSDFFGGSIGHANLDGTGERTLITNAGPSCGVALGGGYLYWASSPLGQSGTIGRALLSGASPNRTFITGLQGPCGIATYSHYLYFADGSTVDRTDLDSPNPTASTQQLVMGNNNACGVALDSLYTGRLAIVGWQSVSHGTVRLELNVSNPGSIVIEQLSGTKELVKHLRRTIRRAGELALTIRPTHAALLLLRSRSSLFARVQISYTPNGGIPTTQSARLGLKLR
jgi:hypothetical protein